MAIREISLFAVSQFLQSFLAALLSLFRESRPEMRGETREGEEGKQAGGRADLKLEIPVFFLAS